jgi:hypothetical protein
MREGLGVKKIIRKKVQLMGNKLLTLLLSLKLLISKKYQRVLRNSRLSSQEKNSSLTTEFTTPSSNLILTNFLICQSAENKVWMRKDLKITSWLLEL